jgi:Xaa-Pro aminopeptidase
LGKLPDIAYKAHQTALDIQAFIQENMKPGVICEDLYNGALTIAQEAGMAEYFMGCRQQAKFVGHGVGLVINELPVLAPRMKEPLQAGMVLAVEPKMVIEGIGAVGVENTFIVTENGGEKLVSLSDEIIDLLA